MGRFEGVTVPPAQIRRKNSSKPPFRASPGFQPAPLQKASGLKGGGQRGHPRPGPTLLPAERCDQVVEHRPEHCRGCASHLQGTDADPIRRQGIEVPPITPVVIEHRTEPPCLLRLW